MLIAYGVTALAKSRNRGVVDGIGQYSHYLADALAKSGDCELLLASHVPPNTKNDTLVDVSIGPFKRQVAKSFLLRQTFDETQLIQQKPALFHATDHYIPRYKSIPVVATIHDAIPFDFPHWFSFQQRRFHTVLKQTMRWPDHFITISNYSKSRILQQLGVPESKVSVVRNGVDSKWYKLVPASDVQTTLKNYGLERPYILFIGTIQKRKNLNVLLKAVDLLPPSLKDSYDVVVVGGLGKQDNDSIRQLLSAVEAQKIKWLDYCPDAQLVTLMQAAKCFVFPSLAEGFGLPILEAFAAGTPVIASNFTSIPEVAGDAALLFDPRQPEELAAKLTDILLNQRLVSDLVAKGLKRSKGFSWEITAAETLAVYQSVIKRPIDACQN